MMQEVVREVPSVQIQEVVRTIPAPQPMMMQAPSYVQQPQMVTMAAPTMYGQTGMGAFAGESMIGGGMQTLAAPTYGTAAYGAPTTMMGRY